MSVDTTTATTVDTVAVASPVLSLESLAGMSLKDRKEFLAKLKEAQEVTKGLIKQGTKEKKDGAQAERDNLLALILDLPNSLCEVEVGEKSFSLSLREALDGSVKTEIADAKSGTKTVTVAMQIARVKALTANVEKIGKMFRGEQIRNRKNGEVDSSDDVGTTDETATNEPEITATNETPDIVADVVEKPKRSRKK